MESLTEYALKSKYVKVKKLRSQLEDVKNLINWKKFLKFFSKEEVGPGRPAYNKILMIKTLFLQACYGLSDEELEYQLYNRLDFQQFLDFPKTIPDYSTIWRFREELCEGNKLDKIWYELQRQMKLKNIEAKEGFIQDAKFIVAEPGRTRSGMNERGAAAKTNRNRDGSWGKKGNKWYFGYKLHTKVQKGTKLIIEMAITPAHTHDGKIDLSEPDDIMYRDKGYSGIPCNGKGDATMKRGKLTPQQKRRNKRIEKQRAEGEHPFGTMVRSFKAGVTKLTTIPRVFVQQAFVCMTYNITRLRYLVS